MYVSDAIAHNLSATTRKEMAAFFRAELQREHWMVCRYEYLHKSLKLR
jgi:hypothetical protein